MSVPGPLNTVLSDTAGAWQGEDAQSAVPSVRSINSLRRREQADAEYQAAAEQRRRLFEEQEARLKREMDEAMSVGDVKSEQGRANPRPLGSAVDEEADVMQRRLDDLRHEAGALERMIAHRTSGVVAPNPHPLSQSVTPSTPPLLPLASFGVKIKVKEPKPWTGEFDMVKREGWIKTVALGLMLVTAGSRSFQSRMSSRPLRSHWADDHAAEQALSRYRAARQGTMRARDFGAALDALADACSDRKIEDLDRRTTFLGGLHSSVQDFVRTQLASLKALGKSDATFDEVVKIAALTDGLASFSSKKTSPLSAGPMSSASKKTNANDPSSLSPKVSSSPSSSRGPSTWTQDAQSWQASHPVASKADWFDARPRPTTKPVRCYNCGDLGTHFSRACTALRKNPKGVVVAMLSKMRISSLSASPSPPVSAAAAPSVPVIASANRFESLSEDEGKANEE
ncbi:hypothetical protein JCM11641_004620 [Rhodosporidiobolus odoratus]